MAFLGNGQARLRMCSRKNTFQAAVAALEKEMAESFVQANAAQLLLKKHVLSKEQKRMVKRQYWPFLAMAAIESGMACSFIHTRSRKGDVPWRSKASRRRSPFSIKKLRLCSVNAKS